MTERTSVGGIPVECLSGESAAIWSGWRTLGDREVVREASAKGTHIKLAYYYLSHRKNCAIDQVEDYFNKEVQIWVNELLGKRQVHRASHVLKNVGLNPTNYVLNVCLTCQESKLRQYLAEHMINTSGFEIAHLDAWNIIKCLLEYEGKYGLQDKLSSTLSINAVMDLLPNIKQALCTELYFYTNDVNMLKTVTNTMVWNYLLSNNRINLIQSWISTQYSSDAQWNSDIPDEHLKSIFSDMSISPDMIECIDSSDASTLIKNLTKNCLCKYGVFTQKERNDFKLTLARIFNSAMTLSHFENLLAYKTCNFNKEEFLNSMNKTFCAISTNNNSDETGLKTLKLLNALNDMCNNHNETHTTTINAIVETVQYLSSDVNEFLMQNHFITFAIVSMLCCNARHMSDYKKNSMFKNDQFSEMFTSSHGLQIGNIFISHKTIQHTLEQIPILQSIIKNEKQEDDITMYNLLDGYKTLNAKEFFKWRFNNEIIPSFSDVNLVKTYGFKEILTYDYYLKEGRPNMAIHNLKHTKSNLNRSLSSQRKSKMAYHTHIFALRNLSKSDIVCACVSFIEMLGLESENLRLHITVANYVQKYLNMSIENVLEEVMYKNENSLKLVISYLERSLKLSWVKHGGIISVERFIKFLRVWDVIVRFARVHNTTLPDILLKLLVEQNRWFEYILVGHIFAYSVEQMLECAKEFNNPVIREHLSTCLNNSQLAKLYFSLNDEPKIKSREALQSSHPKIASKQCTSPAYSSSLSSSDTTGSDSYISASAHTPIRQNVWTPQDDLWLKILKCHQSQDPPRALINASRQTLTPILTILATCYEPSSATAYCYTWMAISTANADILFDYSECLEQQIWPIKQVLNLIVKMVTLGYVNVLNRAYKIFMPESPFNAFFDFLAQCINYCEFEESQENLNKFKSLSSSLKCNKIINWESSDSAYSNNLYWIITVAVRCIVTALGHCFHSTQTQIKFLNALLKSNWEKDLPVDIPNFQLFINLLKVLIKTDVHLDFTACSFTNNTYDISSEINRCITELLKHKNYGCALELSKIANLDASDIILAQLRTKFIQYVNTENTSEGSFWKQCAKDFDKHNVHPEKAAAFFIEHVEKVDSHKERYEILKLTIEILKTLQREQQVIDALETVMWKSCILAGPENINLNEEVVIFNKLKTELLATISNLHVTCTLEDGAEKEGAEALINKLIDLGKLDIALRISTIFNYKHKDLQILMLCLSLAEGELLPTDLNAQQKAFLTDASKNKQKYSTLRNRGLRRLSSSSSLNIPSPGSSFVAETNDPHDVRNVNMQQIQMECRSILEKLLEVLEHGAHICERVLLCYKLATRLGRSYQSLLVLSDPIQFLQKITDSNVSNKYETVNDIILAYKVSNESVAKFLAENITANITSAVEGGHEDTISMWGYSLDANFHLIMELCSDVSLLGSQLLETTHKLLGHSHGERRSVVSLKIIIELLIRSHNCFTASCNMEGIASVLRKCQHLANSLQNLKYWTLLVRLVTGVGRFTEMNYVFQMLKENDHFEFLLGKGLDKVPGLKIALLEFLKRYCPEEKDLFTLVALHFRLYREIALMWETEAKDIIKGLISDATKDCDKLHNNLQMDIKLTKNEHVQKQLQTAVANLTHATQYYLQDNKLNLASWCAHHAQLIAVQISLLDATSPNQQSICILNLKNDDIDKILCQHLNFPQALIVECAYNHHVDWANIIYTRWVLNGETKFLKDYIAVNKLTATVVQDCVRRYRLEKSISRAMTENMKTLISELKDVECKYALGSQLGFKSIVESMLNDPLMGAYLKDTVWKKGFTAL